MQISFKVRKAETQIGQKIHLVGNIPELGLWKVENAIELKTSEAIYPLWKTQEPILVNDASILRNIQYKYFKKYQDRASSQHIKKLDIIWEQKYQKPPTAASLERKGIKQQTEHKSYDKLYGVNRKIDLACFYNYAGLNHVIVEDTEFNDFDATPKTNLIKFNDIERSPEPFESENISQSLRSVRTDGRKQYIFEVRNNLSQVGIKQIEKSQKQREQKPLYEALSQGDKMGWGSARIEYDNYITDFNQKIENKLQKTENSNHFYLFKNRANRQRVDNVTRSSEHLKSRKITPVKVSKIQQPLQGINNQQKVSPQAQEILDKKNNKTKEVKRGDQQNENLISSFNSFGQNKNDEQFQNGQENPKIEYLKIEQFSTENRKTKQKFDMIEMIDQLPDNSNETQGLKQNEKEQVYVQPSVDLHNQTSKPNDTVYLLKQIKELNSYLDQKEYIEQDLQLKIIEFKEQEVSFQITIEKLQKEISDEKQKNEQLTYKIKQDEQQISQKKDTNQLEDFKNKLEEAKDEIALKNLQLEKSKIVNRNLQNKFEANKDQLQKIMEQLTEQKKELENYKKIDQELKRKEDQIEHLIDQQNQERMDRLETEEKLKQEKEEQDKILSKMAQRFQQIKAGQDHKSEQVQQGNENLLQRIKELNDQLIETQKERNQCQLENQQILENQKAGQTQYKKEIDGLNLEIMNLKIQVQKISSNNKVHEKNTGRETNQNIDEIDKDKQQINDLLAQIADLQSDKDILQKQMESLGPNANENKFSDHQEQIEKIKKKFNSDLEQKQNELKEFNAKFQIQKTQQDQIQKSLDEQVALVNQYKKQDSENKNQQNDYKIERQQKDEQISDLKLKLKTLKKEFENQQKEIQEQQKKINQYLQDINQVNDDKNKLKFENENLKKNQESQKTQSLNEIDQLNLQITDLKIQIEKNQTENKDNKKKAGREINQTDDEIQKYKQQVAELMTQIAEWQTNNNALQKQIENLVKSYQEKIQNDKSAHEKELQDLKDRMSQESEQKFIDLNNKLQTQFQQKRAQDDQKKLEDDKQNLDLHNKFKQETTEKISEKQKEIEQKDEEIKVLSRKFQSKNDKYENLQTDFERVQKSIAQLQEVHEQQLQEQKKNTQIENEKIKTSNQKKSDILEKKIKELNEELFKANEEKDKYLLEKVQMTKISEGGLKENMLEIERLNCQIMDLKVQLNKAENENKEKAKRTGREIAQNNEEKEKQKQEITNLNNQISELQANKKQLQNQIESLVLKHQETIQNDKKIHEQAFKDLKNKIEQDLDSKQKEINALKTKLQETQAQLEQITTKLEEEKQNINKLNLQKQEISQKYNQVQKDAVQNDQKIKELSNQIQSKTQDFEKIQKELKEQQKQLAELQLDHNKLISEIENKESELASKNKDISTLQAENAQQVIDFEQKLKISNQNLTKQIQAIQTQYQQAEISLNQAKANIIDSNNKLTEVQGIRDKQEKELINLKKSIEQQYLLVEQNEQAKTQLEKQIKQLNDQLITEIRNVKKQKALKFILHNRMEKEKASIYNQSIKNFNFWAFKTSKIKNFDQIESEKNTNKEKLNQVQIELKMAKTLEILLQNFKKIQIKQKSNIFLKFQKNAQEFRKLQSLQLFQQIQTKFQLQTKKIQLMKDKSKAEINNEFEFFSYSLHHHNREKKLQQLSVKYPLKKLSYIPKTFDINKKRGLKFSQLVISNDDDLNKTAAKFKCGFCQYVVVDPVECQGCKTYYCKLCEESQKIKNKKCNKKCSGNSKMAELKEQTLIVIEEIQFNCEADGCPFEDKYQAALNHVQTCNSSYHNCVQGCGLAILGKDMEYHCIALCAKTLVRCNTCDAHYCPNIEGKPHSCDEVLRAKQTEEEERKKAIEHEQQILKASQEKLKNTQEDLENKIQESEKLQAQLKEVTSQFENTKKNLKEEQKKLTEKEEEINRKQKEVKRLSDYKKKLDDGISKLKQTLKEEVESKQKMEKDHEYALKRKDNEIKQAISQIDKEKQKTQSKFAQIQELSNSVLKLQSENEKLKETIGDQKKIITESEVVRIDINDALKSQYISPRLTSEERESRKSSWFKQKGLNLSEPKKENKDQEEKQVQLKSQQARKSVYSGVSSKQSDTEMNHIMNSSNLSDGTDIEKEQQENDSGVNDFLKNDNHFDEDFSKNNYEDMSQNYSKRTMSLGKTSESVQKSEQRSNVIMNIPEAVEVKKEEPKTILGKLFGWGTSNKKEEEKSQAGTVSGSQTAEKIKDDDRSLRLAKARALNNIGTEKKNQDQEEQSFSVKNNMDTQFSEQDESIKGQFFDQDFQQSDKLRLKK